MRQPRGVSGPEAPASRSRAARPRAPTGGRPDQAERRFGDGRSCCAEVAGHHVDGVGGHAPVGRQLAAGHRDQPVGGDDDGVASGQVGGAGGAGVVDQGSQPGPDAPVTSPGAAPRWSRR